MTFRCVFVCFIVYFHSNPIVMHYAASSTFYELLCRDARDESKTAVRLIATDCSKSVRLQCLPLEDC